MSYKEVKEEFERYVREKEIAARTDQSIFTLRNNRHLGRGFPYVKNGRQVRYPLLEVLRIMESRKITPEAEK